MRIVAVHSNRWSFRYGGVALAVLLAVWLWARSQPVPATSVSGEPFVAVARTPSPMMTETVVRQALGGDKVDLEDTRKARLSVGRLLLRWLDEADLAQMLRAEDVTVVEGPFLKGQPHTVAVGLAVGRDYGWLVLLAPERGGYRGVTGIEVPPVLRVAPVAIPGHESQGLAVETLTDERLGAFFSQLTLSIYLFDGGDATLLFERPIRYRSWWPADDGAGGWRGVEEHVKVRWGEAEIELTSVQSTSRSSSPEAVDTQTVPMRTIKEVYRWNEEWQAFILGEARAGEQAVLYRDTLLETQRTLLAPDSRLAIIGDEENLASYFEGPPTPYFRVRTESGLVGYVRKSAVTVIQGGD